MVNVDHRSDSRSRWVIGLIWIGILALATIGGGGFLAKSLPRPTLEISLRDLPVEPWRGLAYEADLSSLGIAGNSDQLTRNQIEPSSPDARHQLQRSPLVLLENGLPLFPHSSRRTIVKHPGLTSHWGNVLCFSASDGSDPRTNGKEYRLRYPRPDPDWDRWTAVLYTSDRWLTGIAVALLLLLTGLAWHRPGLLAGRALPIALGVALASTLVLQQLPSYGQVLVQPDSDSYTYPPGTSPWRGAGVTLFMQTVAPMEAVRSAIVQGTERGGFIYGDWNHPLVQIITWQRLVMLLALLACFPALTGFMPAPLAALLILAIGYQEKWSGSMPRLPDGGSWLPALFAAIGLALLYRRHRLARPALTIAGMLFGGAILWDLLWNERLYSEQDAAILSEGLSMACNLLLTAMFLAYCRRGELRWLPPMAVVGGVAFLIRPAEIFVFGMMVLVILHALLGTAPHRIRIILVSTLLACAVVLAPSVYYRLAQADGSGSSSTFVHASGLVWTFSCFMLQLADDQDEHLFNDPTTREYFTKVMAKKRELPPGRRSEKLMELGEFDQNFYNVITPVMASMQPFPDPATTPEKILSTFNRLLLQAHWRDYLRLIGHAYLEGASKNSRVTRSGSLRRLLLGLAVLSLVVYRPVVWAASILLFGHFLHLAVVTILNQPAYRYVYATEFLVAIALFLMMAAALDGWLRPDSPTVAGNPGRMIPPRPPQ